MSVARFLNVDLDVRSRSDLRPMVHALGRISPNHVEARFASIELYGITGGQKSLDFIIEALVRKIERLPRTPRLIWDNCQERVFDIGIEAGTQFPAGAFTISRRALEAIERVGGTVRITVYPPTSRVRGTQGRKKQ